MGLFINCVGGALVGLAVIILTPDLADWRRTLGIALLAGAIVALSYQERN